MPMKEPPITECALPEDPRHPVVRYTGLAPSQGATLLVIYHIGSHTYVSTSGEVQNASPYRYDGIYGSDQVLQWYLEAMSDG